MLVTKGRATRTAVVTAQQHGELHPTRPAVGCLAKKGPDLAQQHLSNVLRSCHIQWRLPGVICGVDIGTIAQQPLDGLHSANRGREMERRGKVPVRFRGAVGVEKAKVVLEGALVTVQKLRVPDEDLAQRMELLSGQCVC